MIGVDEVAHQPVAIAVEVDAHEFSRAIEHRAAGVAADGVRGRDEVERRRQIEFVLAIEPTFRQVERLMILLLLGPIVHLAKRRRVAELDAVHVVAPHGAEREPQREGGVGSDGRADRLGNCRTGQT